jgi:hypothetical protein
MLAEALQSVGKLDEAIEVVKQIGDPASGVGLAGFEPATFGPPARSGS